MMATTTADCGNSRPESPPRYDVLVVGAGVTGMALAIALADSLPAGRGIAVVDRAPPRADLGANVSRDGRAAALTTASVQLLSALGLWSSLERHAQAVSRIEITDSALKAGLRPVLLAYETATPDGAASMFILPNAVLEATLAASVSARSNITLLSSAAISEFTPGPESVSAVFDDGRIVEARLLAACDGRRSKLRELAGIGTVGWPYRQTAITTVVSHSEPHHAVAVQHFLPGGPFALLPLPGDRTCVTWSEDAAEAERILALDDTGFLGELDRRVGGRLGALQLEGRRQSWPLDMFLARAFVGRRLALVGDAAHGVHPIAGQGVNLGLKDVAALAEVTVEQARLGLDIGAAEPLSRYERWRRFDTMTSAAGFDVLNRLFSNDLGLMRSFRSMGLEAVEAFPFLKRGLVAEAAGVTGTIPRLMRGEPI